MLHLFTELVNVPFTLLQTK